MIEEKIFKYLEGELNEREKSEVERKFKKEIEFYRELIEISGSLPRYEVPEDIWSKIEGKILGKTRKYLIAASIILTLIAGGFLYSFLKKENTERRVKKKEVEMVVESWERSLKVLEYFERSHPEYSNLLKEARRKLITEGERTLQVLETSWRR